MLIDLHKSDLWSLDFEFSWKCQFSGHFWIDLLDIEMKLGMIELQIKFEFLRSR
jgi:hypothetical protein